MIPQAVPEHWVALFVGAVKIEVAPVVPMFIAVGKLGVNAEVAIKVAIAQLGQTLTSNLFDVLV